MADEAAPAPTRSYMEDPDIKWREGSKPDFSLVDKKYMAERRMRHKADSLEKIVENLVKTWEMESTHKIREKDWGTVDPDTFTICSNYGKKFTLTDNIAMGNYQMLMCDSPLYDADNETNESSQKLFRTAFKSGYAWEVLEVYSGPPVVSFTWRHWGTWEGPYKDVAPTGETLEMFGSCVTRVTDDLKIQSIEVFYDPNPLIATLMKFKRPTGCPFSIKK